MKVREVIEAVEALAPVSEAEDWDNVGLQVGDAGSTVETCLLALDVTPETIDEAKRLGAALVIAHHPLIFGGLSSLTPGVPAGETIIAAVRMGVSVYAAHTNLDASLECGTCPALADRLGLECGPALVPSPRVREEGLMAALTGTPEQVEGALAAVDALGEQVVGWNVWEREGKAQARGELTVSVEQARGLQIAARDHGARMTLGSVLGPIGNFGTGMVCRVPQIALGGFAEYVARKLGTGEVRVVGSDTRAITSAALVPGSGGGLVEIAARRADVLITGEIKYHDALRAAELGLAVLAAGHYETERPVLDMLADRLRRRFGNALRVAVSQLRSGPFWTWRGA